MAKTCHKHVGLMLYVRNNKIKNMGNKILVLVGGETKKNVWFSHFAVTRRKKGALFFGSSWPN